MRDDVTKAPSFVALQRSNAHDETVSDLKFWQMIKIADELGWIPPSVVNAELLEAVILDFPALAGGIYPKWSKEQVGEKCAALKERPGLEMLKVAQDIRNLIHPPRWIKTSSLLVEDELSANCKLATIVSAEIAQCLLLRLAENSAKIMERTSALIQNLGPKELAELSEEVRRRFGQ